MGRRRRRRGKERLWWRRSRVSEMRRREKEPCMLSPDGGETRIEVTWRCVGKLADALPLGCVWSHSLTQLFNRIIIISLII